MLIKDIHAERYAGSVAIQQLLLTMTALGIAPIGYDRKGDPIWPMAGGSVAPIQGFMAERAKLLTEFDALRTVAEASEAKDYTSEQADRREAIMARVGVVDQNIKAEEWRRDQERTAEAIVVDASAQATHGKAPHLFDTFGEQMISIMAAGYAVKSHADIDPRLTQIQAATGASTLTGADGGFAVQTDFSEAIVQRVYEVGQLASRATKREIGAGKNSVSWNEVDETSRATGSRYGGVQVYWVAEGGAGTLKRPTYRNRKVALAKMIGMYVPTSELLEDAVALQSFVEGAFVDEMAFSLDDQMIRGTGAGLPQGILTAAATVSVAKETGQSAATLISKNVRKMYQRMSPSSLGNAVWFINNSVWEEIWSLNEPVGTGGVPMFIPAGGLTDTPAGTLLGRPIMPIEQAEALGTKGDVIFADWSRYLLFSKGGIRPATSIHVYFDTDEVAFRWTWRINGEPADQAPVTPYKGSTTTSPFVLLDTRA